MRVAGPSPLWQLTLVKVREFLREPEAIFWVLIFPVLLALALGIAFRSRPADVIAVAVQAGATDGEVLRALEAEPGLAPSILPAEEARERLRTGKVALVVVPGDPPTYTFDPTRQESRFTELLVDGALQKAAGRLDPLSPRRSEVTEKGSRYIDFLIPGLLGMNLMGTGMWGIGFAIVSARSKRLLKRLIATPMRRSHYLLSQITGRLIFLLLEVSVLVLFAHYVFEVPLEGSLVLLSLVTLLGAMTFAGLGVLVASRAATIEGVSGLMNFVMLPMWMLSGIFFSTSRFPEAMQPLIHALPLTALNDALRAVMIDGASAAAVAGEMGILAVWGGLSFVAALRIFRWQ